MSAVNYLLHPPLTTIGPILLILTWCLEGWRMWKGATASIEFTIKVTLSIACAGVVLAYVTGTIDHMNTTMIAEETLEHVLFHQTMGQFLLFLTIPCYGVFWCAVYATQGRGIFYGVYIILLSLSVTVSVYTAYIGGQLVFRHGVGVAS